MVLIFLLVYLVFYLSMTHSLLNMLVAFFMFTISMAFLINSVLINAWITFLLVICLLGGLMISFTYMVYLCPNILKSTFLIGKMRVLWVTMISVHFINFNHYETMNKGALNLELSFILINTFYVWVITGLFLFMFWLLLFIDWNMGVVKKWSRIY